MQGISRPRSPTSIFSIGKDMARGVKIPKAIVDKCLLLRKQGRLSLREIQKQTGVGYSTLSNILKDDPLTRKEIAEKHRGIKYRTRRIKALLPETSSPLVKLLGDRKLSRESKGRIAEAAVLLRLSVLEFKVYGSPFDNERDDWIVQTSSGRFAKLQVRWLRWVKHGAPLLKLTRTMATGKKLKIQRFKAADFDIIVGYDFSTDSAYVFTFDELQQHVATKTVTLEAKEAWHKLDALVA